MLVNIPLSAVGFIITRAQEKSFWLWSGFSNLSLRCVFFPEQQHLPGWPVHLNARLCDFFTHFQRARSCTRDPRGQLRWREKSDWLREAIWYLCSGELWTCEGAEDRELSARYAALRPPLRTVTRTLTGVAAAWLPLLLERIAHERPDGRQ